MRVLFLDHPEGDFLAANFYLGLQQELGPDGVVEFPWKPSYHGEVHRYPSFYEEGKEGCTGPFAWMPALPGRAWGRDEVLARIREFDAVAVVPRALGIATFESFAQAVGRGNLPRVGILDGEDYTSIRWDLVEKIRPHCYHKVSRLAGQPEYFQDALARLGGWSPRMFGIGYGSALPELPAVAKDVDVAFLGGANWKHPDGRQAKPEVVARLASLGARCEVGHLGYREYLDVLARARIAIATAGSGPDALRNYEAPSFAGTLLCREPYRQVDYPDPFVDGQTCATFSSPDELMRKVEHYLAHEDDRRRVAEAGNRHLRERWSSRAVAKRWLAEVMS